MKRLALVLLLAALALAPALADGISNPAGSAAPSGAAGGGLAGTYPNPTVAAVPASAMPALTGDCTTSAGAVATTCSRITAAAATTTNTTATCNGGAGLTGGSSIAWRYWAFGKLVYFEADVSPAFTTCTGFLIFPLPTGTTQTAYAASGFNSSSGLLVSGFMPSAGTVMNVFKYDGTFPSTTGQRIVISGFYEIQ